MSHKKDKDNKFDSNLNNATTLKDIKAVSLAGMDFVGNEGVGKEIHRNLGTKLTIKGEGTDNKANFNSVSGNILVTSDDKNNELTVKLSSSLNNMESFETKEIAGDIKFKTKIDRNGISTTFKNDDDSITTVKTDENGFTISKDTPLGKATYGLDKASIVDSKGNTTIITPKSISLGEVNSPSIVINNGGETDPKTPFIEFAKNAGVIDGLADIENDASGNRAVNKNYVDKKVNTLEGTASGIANAIALANLTQVQHRGGYRHQVAGAYGTYNGEHAFGLGLSGITKGGQVMYKESGSFTRGKFAAGVGLGYQFDKEEIIEDELVTELRKEAKEAKNETSRLKAKLEENDKKLEANNKKLEKNNKKLEEKDRELKELKEQLSMIAKKVLGNNTINDSYMINSYKIGSYKLNERQIKELKTIVEELNANHMNKSIEITGFADITSNEKYNLEIGLYRAKFVAGKLVELGLDESIVIRKVSSYGHNSIIDTNVNKKGRLNNRRVEIAVK